MARPDDREPYVFVSYASADRARVFGIAGVLEAQGIHVWLDRRSITGGRRWTTEIVRGVEDCAVLLVMCSPASVASRNVQQEVQLAWESSRPMLPLIVEDVQLPAEMRYALAGQQWVEVRDRLEAEWLPELVSALAAAGVKSSDGARNVGDSVPTSLPPEPLAEIDYEADQRKRHNLPAPRASFVGREAQLDDVRQALRTSRIVTLTGPGGIGKSRLALELAWQVMPDYPDGVWLAPLENASTATDVEQMVAAASGVPEVQGRPLTRQLAAMLSGRQTLLVLDNCERLLEPCAELAAALLGGGPELRLLVTSRELLGIAGEKVIAIPSLEVPGADVESALVPIAQCESVQLFVDRASSVAQGFQLSRRNIAAVADICRAVDGIPLAIELAASRTRTLTPQEISSRIHDVFALLRGTDRTLLPRQRTLEAAITWSHDALSEPERVLWRRLAIFAESFTLRAAEAICALSPIDPGTVLDLLTALVDKSMVISVRGETTTRYRLLKTLQQYAEARLVESGEVEALGERHAHWCADLTASGTPELVRQEYPNVRAAVLRLLASGDAAALRRAEDIAGQESMYHVFFDSYPGEAVRILSTLVAQLPRELSAPYGWMLCTLGRVLDDSEKWQRAKGLLEDALSIARELGSHRLVDRCLLGLGSILGDTADWEGARARLTEAIEHARACGLNPGNALTTLAGVLITQCDDREAARPLLEEALGLGIRTGLPQFCLAIIACRDADLEEAERLARLGLAEARFSKTVSRVVRNLQLLGAILVHRGDALEGEKLLKQALRLVHDERHTLLPSQCHELARASWLQGRLERAVTIFALTDRPKPISRPNHQLWEPDALLAEARSVLGQNRFDECWAAGKAMNLEQAVAYALAEI